MRVLVFMILPLALVTKESGLQKEIKASQEG